MRTLKISQAILVEQNLCEDGTLFVTMKKMVSKPTLVQNELTAQDIIDELNEVEI